MTSQEDLQRIIEVAQTLDPRAVSSEVSLMTGARLKSANLDRAGGRSSDPPSPGFDKIDKYVRRRHQLYRQILATCARQLATAAFIEAELTVRLHDEHGTPSDEARHLAAEDHGPQAVECANCARPVERTANDKLLAGRCRPCHDYLKAHGTERPRDLWVAS